MTSIIILSLVGMVIAVIVGSIWYSDKTPMGRLHMKTMGVDKLSHEEKMRKMEEMKPKMPKMFAAQAGLSLLTSFAVVYIITMSVRGGLTFGMAILFPLFSWLCFIVPTMGSGVLWSNGDPKLAWKKFASDALSSLVTILLIAVVTGLFL